MVVRSAAPGRLELVRSFLNTWRLPHDTRVPEDRLPDLVANPWEWRKVLPGVPHGHRRELDELTELRTALRHTLGIQAPYELRDWLDRHPVLVTIGEEQPIEHRPRDPGAAAALLALVVDGVAQRRWARLKACPDCKHVFYDHSRNGTRTWCGMYANQPGGRACGSIAKVRAYRERKRDQPSTADS
ncbi:CGNR zinc finger domain-containing protein [Amycolatopsis anabasis]|uniref:CGNR zinc finger domain-containing protein n=1 Tax=Amycolatopsis anabasis TaxID=1840409 RepID=UPI00131D7581|nr:CGNR zinc finger domain-containing protein [Amycolatopsis anabasis]